jgi:hypothetical protein
MDDLIADAQSILRLKVTRKAMSAASRVCKKTAEERRIRQLMHPTRILRMGATAICLSTTAAYLRSGSRWGGYRSRYRRSHVKRPARPKPVEQHAPRRLATLRKTADDQFALNLRRADDMRRLARRLPARGSLRLPNRPSISMIKLPRFRLRKSSAE